MWPQWLAASLTNLLIHVQHLIPSGLACAHSHSRQPHSRGLGEQQELGEIGEIEIGLGLGDTGNNGHRFWQRYVKKAELVILSLIIIGRSFD